MTLDRLDADPLVQDAEVRCAQVVGEAAGRLLAESPGPLLEPLRPSLRAATLSRTWLVHGHADIRLDVPPSGR